MQNIGSFFQKSLHILECLLFGTGEIWIVMPLWCKNKFCIDFFHNFDLTTASFLKKAILFLIYLLADKAIREYILGPNNLNPLY